MRISSLAGSELRSPTSDRREGPGPALAHELAQRAHLFLAHATVVVAPAQVRGRRPGSARAGRRSRRTPPVAPRPRRRPRPRPRGQRAHVVAGDRPPCDHRVARAHAVRERQVGGPHRACEPELRGQQFGLVVRAVVPHLLQADDVGVDAAQGRADRRCAPLPRAVARPEVPRRDANARLDERAVSRVVDEIGASVTAPGRWVLRRRRWCGACSGGAR